MRRTMMAGVLVLLGGCAGGPERADVSEPAFAWTVMSDGLRVDLDRRVVEFNARVATDVHDPATPVVWLELFVTGPNSREHESILVTTVPASLIHAALLSVGAEAGAPGLVSVGEDGLARRRVATGSPLRVEFVHSGRHGGESVFDPAELVVREGTGSTLAEDAAWPQEAGAFVFAGSRMVARGERVVYDADGTGVIVPLTTFGSGVIAPRLTLSHAAAVDEPVWVARNELIPPVGAPMAVRVTVLEADSE